jgi:tetratricopeptide (TPR) repeat protein
MANLMQLAAIDFSHQRYPDAIDKYAVLHTYYQTAGVPSMQALALLGAGDALRALGELEPAKQRLQQGIALAMEHKCLPVLLNLLISIVQTCMELRHFEDAESYAHSGARVAAAVLNPFACADLYEMKGDAEVAQDRRSAAVETYRQCAELCKKYEYVFRWASVLERQKQLYAAMNLPEEEQALASELQAVRAMEQPQSRSSVQAAS